MTATFIHQGDAIYHVPATDDNSGTNAYMGKAVRKSGDTDATVRVRLEQ